MSPSGTPVIDPRDTPALVADVLDRLPSYVPGWVPAADGPGRALVHVFAQHLQALVQRLNQAPDKNKLAFLDAMGVNLLPSQGARAPVVFQARPRLPDSRIPAGTRLGAAVGGQPEPVIFETEKGIALVAAQLTEVVTVWPGRDVYADHGAEVQAGTPFTLFEPARPVPHELYLAHETHFALAGRSVVELQLQLSSPASQPLPFAWEYWDGKEWRAFKEFRGEDLAGESFDATVGLTRSGVIRLAADCAETAPRKVNGVTGRWIRGRVTAPVPSTRDLRPAVVDQVRVRTVIQAEGLPADSARADGFPLDLTKSFLPFGARAEAGNVFYISSKDAFAKPGATVTLTATHVEMPQETTGAGKGVTVLAPDLVAECWDGERWSPLAAPGNALRALATAGSPVAFTLPRAVAPTTVNGEASFWVRVRITRGGFVRTRSISLGPTSMDVLEYIPPALSDLRVSYV